MEKHERRFWSEQTLTWYTRAAEESRFHEQLASILTRQLSSEESLCDLGCGPGYLDRCLMKYRSEMTAIDQDPGALGILEQDPISGLHVCRADAMNLPGDWQWDQLLLSFFGRITSEGNFDYFMSHCRKRMISVVNAAPISSFSATGFTARTKEFRPKVEKFLHDRHQHFHTEEYALEFGQPLLDEYDAREFIRHQSPAGALPENDFPLPADMVHLPDGRLYLPHQKRIAVFVIDKE